MGCLQARDLGYRAWEVGGVTPSFRMKVSVPAREPQARCWSPETDMMSQVVQPVDGVARIKARSAHLVHSVFLANLIVKTLLDTAQATLFQVSR